MQSEPVKSTLSGHRTLFVGLAVLLFISALAVVTSSSAVCASCHQMSVPADALRTSSHASLSCYECHLADGPWDWPGAKVAEWTRMYPKALGGDALAGPAVRTSSSACMRCHDAVMDSVAESGGFRIDHATCAADVASCDGCHSTIAHGEVVRWVQAPVMESCVACHQERGVSDACDMCHAGEGESERLMRGPWQVTHGSEWRSTHGMGSIQFCATCHPADYCVDCHGIALPHPVDFGRTHGAASLTDPESCDGCHAATLCDTCHGIPMPHPEGFRAEHSGLAESREDPACLQCHQTIDCIECHARHAHPGNTDGTLGQPPNGAIAPVEVEVE